MNKSVLPTQALARVFNLRITLSERFDAAAIDHWRKRLHAYLSAHGLLSVIAPEHIIVLPAQREQILSPFEKGIVLGWLVAQPEVVVVRVEPSGQAGLGHGPQATANAGTLLEFRQR